MDFEVPGIPDAFRTLVVVPVLLVDAAKIRKEVEKLEIRYLANKEANLLFSLFTDYTDCGQAHCEEDEQLLQVALESLEALNHRYGGPFFLFHRERTWSKTERQFIGWERKRGKLEELNRFIDGTRSEDEQQLVYVGDQDLLFNVRFIITLDSDTQLPHGTARRMIETLAHPLNQPRFSPEGDILAGSYALIQPRVSQSLPSTSATPFSRLFSDPIGIDPYTSIVSDVNQDLTGEGSYHGKGIYDVRAFSRVLSGRFPEGLLLSHDLIEGAHVRVGLASDIELYDDVPQDYLSYTGRQHRWIRGDWQIADWVLPRVPHPGKRRGPNQLSWFNRWKVMDNLRRSLVPVAALGLLTTSWLVSSPAGWISTLMVAVMLLFHPIAQHLTLMTSHLELKSFSFSKLTHDLLRSVVEAALLPHQAGLALDAIARVLYRRLVSHLWLLEWASAKGGRGSASGKLLPFVASMGVASVFSGIVGWTVYHWMPSNLVMAGPWLVMWFLSPFLGWLLSLRLNTNRNRSPLSSEDVDFLRDVARRTWRYFSDFVTDETSWLPPDNYQVFHQNRLAMRTSPTNIGLWMLSAIAAQEFGYLTVDQVVEKLSHSMETIAKLERYEGHLLNWYDIKTLTPLEPRYVSTVDSGNLLVALWTLEQGLEKLIERPVLDSKVFDGLRDTGKTLKLVVEREGFTGINAQALDGLLRVWESPPERIADSLHLLRRTKGIASTLANEGREFAGADAEAVYWALQVEGQASAWEAIAERYIAWVDVLNEKTEEEVAGLGQDALVSFRHALRHAPSLFDLANGRVDFIEALRAMGGEVHSVPGSLLEWRNRLLQAFEKSKWLAGEVLGLEKQLVSKVRELSASADLRFLYDPERRLFSIGFNVSEGRLDRAYYDLLASEARLGSLVAMARGDVPIEHWFSMSRPYRASGRNRVLLSWSGTMFEYLMPLIFHHSYGAVCRGVSRSPLLGIWISTRRISTKLSEYRAWG
jgi:cyclic beta-1,2-glucan synthetase